MGFFQRHQKHIIAALAIILALALILSLISSVFISASAASQEEIDELKQSASELQDQMKDLENDLDELKDEIDSALSQKVVLEEEINLLNDQIKNTREQISEYNAVIDEYEETIAEYDDVIADYDAKIADLDTTIADYDRVIEDYDGMIDQAEEDLAEKEEEESEHYDEYCLRVRALEEMGPLSYLDILFSAANFADLLDRITLVGEIMAYDKSLSDQLEQDRIDIENKKDELTTYREEQVDARAKQESAREEQVAARQEQEDARQEQEDAKKEQEDARAEQEALLETRDAQRAELSEKETEVDDLINELEEQQDVYESQLNVLQNENSAIDTAIAEKQAELEAQLSSSNTSITSESGYMWPLSNRYTLSSLFGNRTDPITGQPGNHKGIDIPAPAGTSIFASKSGIVITSGYDSSYGNYVVISHGNNDSTLYAHMSKRAVSVGASVSQGQVVGYVGTTGRSTGNHLHFEVRVNGNRVDPVNMFPDLTLYYSSSGSTVVLPH